MNWCLSTSSSSPCPRRADVLREEPTSRGHVGSCCVSPSMPPILRGPCVMRGDDVRPLSFRMTTPRSIDRRPPLVLPGRGRPGGASHSCCGDPRGPRACGTSTRLGTRLLTNRRPTCRRRLLHKANRDHRETLTARAGTEPCIFPPGLLVSFSGRYSSRQRRPGEDKTPPESPKSRSARCRLRRGVIRSAAGFAHWRLLIEARMLRAFQSRHPGRRARPPLALGLATGQPPQRRWDDLLRSLRSLPPVQEKGGPSIDRA